MKATTVKVSKWNASYAETRARISGLVRQVCVETALPMTTAEARLALEKGLPLGGRTWGSTLSLLIEKGILVVRGSGERSPRLILRLDSEKLLQWEADRYSLSSKETKKKDKPKSSLLKRLEDLERRVKALESARS